MLIQTVSQVAVDQNFENQRLLPLIRLTKKVVKVSPRKEGFSLV